MAMRDDLAQSAEEQNIKTIPYPAHDTGCGR